jgi:hypothetical protein
MLKNSNWRKLGIGCLLVLAIAVGFLGGRALADQPHMRAALEHLRAARSELQSAEHDKGGHRTNALRLVNEAIGQVERGVQFDRTH